MSFEFHPTMQKFVILLGLLAVGAVADYKTYKGYQVWEVTPKTVAEFDVLKEWEVVPGIDYGDSLSRRGTSKVIVAPEVQSQYETFLTQNGIAHEIVIADLESSVIEERERNIEAQKTKTSGRSAAGDFHRYWTLDEMNDYFEMLATQFPNLVRLFDVETSFEGRPIKAMVISRDESANNPVVFVDGGVHAREWAGHMAVIYLLYQLVERSAFNSELLDNLDWAIVPMANPDGYVYTHTTERFWRKNRRPINAQCVGVDNNRNFAFEWRAGTQPCSDIYSSQSPLSEPENRAINNVMQMFLGRIGVYLGTHTCGDMMLWPHGWTFGSPVPNWQEHQSLGEEIAAAIRALTGTDFIVDNGPEVLGTAFGSSYDHAYEIGRSRIAYTLELRCGGSWWFDLPPEQLFEVVQEGFVIYRYAGRYVSQL